MCEYSGIVRDAFTKLGWDATSADILPTEAPGKHIEGDVRKLLKKKYDIAIGFPPCTVLSYAGMQNWYDPGRCEERIKAAQFFMDLYNVNADHVCIENPQGIMAKLFREPDQTIHPYYFGEPEMKRTCLWLKNLPKLEYHLADNLFASRTSVDKPKPVAVQIQKKTGKKKNRYFVDAFDDNKKLKTGKERSKSFSAIAQAMAEQWTHYFLSLRQA